MAYDPSRYEARQRAYSGAFEAQSAMNEYARMLAQTRGSRQLGDFRRSVTEQVPVFGRTYGKRGLYGQGVKSGIFSKALSDFGARTTRDEARLLEDLAGQQRQYDLTGSQYLRQYESQLADMEGERARDIGNTASGLLAL